MDILSGNICIEIFTEDFIRLIFFIFFFLRFSQIISKLDKSVGGHELGRALGLYSFKSGFEFKQTYCFRHKIIDHSDISNN